MLTRRQRRRRDVDGDTLTSVPDPRFNDCHSARRPRRCFLSLRMRRIGMSADRKPQDEPQFGPASCEIGTVGSAAARFWRRTTRVDKLEACCAFGQESPAILVCSSSQKGRSGNLFVFKFVGYRLIFVGHPSQAHLQSRIGAVASEPAASVRLFSKIGLIHHRLPYEGGGSAGLSGTGSSQGPYGDVGKLHQVSGSVH